MLPLTTRLDKRQCKKVGKMAAHIVLLMQEGGVEGGYSKATLPNSPKNVSHFFCCLGQMPSCSATMLTMANSSVFAPTMYSWVAT